MAARRRPAPAPRPVVLVYHPDEADVYARLVRAPRGRPIDLHACGSPEAARAVVDQAEVIYAWQFPPALYAGARRLVWVQAMGAGVDWVLGPELPSRVVVTRAPGIFGAWMREYVLGWCAWVTQRMETYRAAQRERRWLGTVLPRRLRGRTLALVGLGDVGREIAGLARAAGLRVIGVSRSGRRVPGLARVYRASGLHRALAEADFVVVAQPLTAETRGLIDGTALAAMRPEAWLLNVGRGAVVDDTALVRALAERRIGGAILDVFATEPLPADHPYWGLDNAVITPHISGPSTPDEIAPIFNRNLARWLARRPLLHVVDRDRGY
jgi:glyoxylate/hydroxypyruvate reductase A